MPTRQVGDDAPRGVSASEKLDVRFAESHGLDDPR
jgi:hypothetical protein